MGRRNVVAGGGFPCLFALVPTVIAGQFAHKAGFSLTGTLFTEGSSQRVENATVVLCDDQGNRLEETRSNSGGEFFFRGIRPENYVLRVRADGFEPVDLHVDLNMNSERGVAINLKAARKSESAVPDRPTISAHELSMPEVARQLVTSGRKKLYKEKNAQGALNDFQAATVKAPNYYEAHYQTGLAYLMLQKEGDAEKEFRKSVELSDKRFG